MTSKLSSFSKIILIAAVFSLLATLLTGCPDGKPTDLEGSVTVYVRSSNFEQFEVDLKQAQMTSDSTVYDLLQYLNDDEQLQVDMSVTPLGAYIAGVEGITLSDNQFVAVFTNKLEWKDTSAFCLPDIEVGGHTVYFSGLGISQAELHDGLVVLLTLAE